MVVFKVELLYINSFWKSKDIVLRKKNIIPVKSVYMFDRYWLNWDDQLYIVDNVD